MNLKQINKCKKLKRDTKINEVRYMYLRPRAPQKYHYLQKNEKIQTLEVLIYKALIQIQNEIYNCLVYTIGYLKALFISLSNHPTMVTNQCGILDNKPKLQQISTLARYPIQTFSFLLSTSTTPSVVPVGAITHAGY